jgi:hypothetical protein
MKHVVMILALFIPLLLIACELKDDEEKTRKCDTICNVMLMNYFDRCDAHPEEPICSDTITGMTFILDSCRSSCGSDSAM